MKWMKTLRCFFLEYFALMKNGFVCFAKKRGEHKFIVLWVTEVDFYAKRGDERGEKTNGTMVGTESNGPMSLHFYEAFRC